MRRLGMLLLLALLLAAPLASARVAARPDEVALAAGGAPALVVVTVTNEARVPLEATLRVEAPADMDARLGRSTLTLMPGASATVDLTLTAGAGARGSRDVALLLHERGSEGSGPIARASVRALVEAPAAPPPDEAAPMEWGPAAFVAGAALLLWLGLRRWGFALAMLYSRLRRESLPQHPARAALLEEVRREPGLSLAELQRRARLANGPFEHHVRTLARFGHLALVQDGPNRRAYLPGARAAAREATAERMLGILRRDGERAASELARELGVTRQTLHHHARRLAREGCVEVRLAGRRLVLALAPGAW